VLYEEVADDRGGRYRRVLGRASWTQTPARANREFRLSFEGRPQSDTLVLEINNGDNAPIELERFQLFLPVTRVLFKARPEDQLKLYYGHAQAGAPQYDLNLVANELLAAEKFVATLAAEEQLKQTREILPAGNGNVVLWVVLGLVVAVLLIIISRLLPKVAAPGP
jgi:hypothetical protein